MILNVHQKVSCGDDLIFGWPCSVQFMAATSAAAYGGLQWFYPDFPPQFERISAIVTQKFFKQETQPVHKKVHSSIQMEEHVIAMVSSKTEVLDTSDQW